MKITIAQLGARKHYQEPILLHQWGLLDTLYTDFYAGNNPIMNSMRAAAVNKRLPLSVRRMSDRFEPALNNAHIIHFPLMGYQYAQACKKANSQEASKLFEEIGDVFCERILKRGLGEANAVYGFNSACLKLFEQAKQEGIRCILDQTIAERSYMHTLLLEEEQRWPNWSVSPFMLSDSDKVLAERETKEQSLANTIICGSSFVRKTLVDAGICADKISVVSLGGIKGEAAPQGAAKQYSLFRNSYKDGLRILFAGSVGLRKGIPYMLEALRRLKGNIPFVCRVAGSIEIFQKRQEEYTDVCQFLGRVPRSTMTELYQWADVFVLPSICEGSAMVTYEAMQYGLPVVCTANTGSISENVPGNWTVPIRDSEAIADALTQLYENGLEESFAIQQKDYSERIRKQSIDVFRTAVKQGENHQ